jgi:hypothetical protein
LEAQCCSADARANKEEWHRLAEEAEPAALGGSLLIILLTAKTRAAGWKRLEVQAETASREVPGEPKTLQHEAEQLSSSPPDALETKAEKPPIRSISTKRQREPSSTSSYGMSPWEVETEAIRYSTGARSVKGRNFRCRRMADCQRPSRSGSRIAHCI